MNLSINPIVLFFISVVKPVIDFTFDTLNLKSLIFANAIENTGSHRVKEKTGARLIDIRPAKYADPN